MENLDRPAGTMKCLFAAIAVHMSGVKKLVNSTSWRKNGLKPQSDTSKRLGIRIGRARVQDATGGIVAHLPAPDTSLEYNGCGCN